jgi:hypothetical protein
LVRAAAVGAALLALLGPRVTAAVPLAGAGVPQAPARSGLPSPPNADIWADALGEFPVTIPGAEPGARVRARAIVFRPRGDNLAWADHVQAFVQKGFIGAGVSPSFSTLSLPPGEAAVADPEANAEDTSAYATGGLGDYLVLGFIRNLRTQHQIAYGVVLNGAKLNAPQALIQGRSLATMLALQYKLHTNGPPRPPGSVAAAPSRALAGQNLMLLLQSIERSLLVSTRVKEMARAVIPQATKVELWTYRTAAYMPDDVIIAFYMEQARRLGWEGPVSRDETQKGRPTLLFQQPNGAGVVMVRSEPTPIVGGIPAGPSNTVVILMLEGKIDVNALRR